MQQGHHIRDDTVLVILQAALPPLSDDESVALHAFSQHEPGVILWHPSLAADAALHLLTNFTAVVRNAGQRDNLSLAIALLRRYFIECCWAAV